MSTAKKQATVQHPDKVDRDHTTTNMRSFGVHVAVPDELGSLARTLAVPYYDDALPAHDEFHANRVRDVALRLAADVDQYVETGVLAAAAWLHDIGRPRERTDDIDDHAMWATREAGELLAAEEVPEADIEAIQHCIRTHSIRASSPNAETIEAKLLFDADKLDATGAVGVTRLACIIGERSGRSDERHAVIDDFTANRAVTADQDDVSVLRKWADERLEALHTEPAQELGASRSEYMDEFLARFHDEIGAEGTQ